MSAHSIRRGLLLWFGTLLVVVVVTFGTLLAWRTKHALDTQVDSTLSHQGSALVAALQYEDEEEDDEEEPEEDDDDDDHGVKFADGWEFDFAAGYLEGVAERMAFEVRDAEGTLLSAWGEQPPREWGSFLAIEEDGEPRFRDHGEFRIFEIGADHGSTIRIAFSVAEEHAAIASLQWGVALGGAALVLLGLFGGAVISGRSLRPITKMSAIAGKLSGEDLSCRIDLSEVPVELADLAATLNRAFERLEAAFDRQARFTADASHELRTPLAVIRTQIEATLRHDRKADDYRETLERCLEATIRMTGIVEGMMTLAHLDADRPRGRERSVLLEEVVRECVDQVEVRARDRSVDLRLDLESVSVVGDPDLLGEVVTNLLENGLRHNSSPGELSLRLTRENGDALLTVADRGPGIPADSLPRIFDRFYRVDRARSRVVGGSGLGLAITRTIVEGHHGSISVESETGKGTTFTVRLPVAADFGQNGTSPLNGESATHPSPRSNGSLESL